MKKLVSVIISVAMLASNMSITALAYDKGNGSGTDTIIKYDVNGDSKIDVSDIVKLQKYILGVDTLTYAQFLSADIDNNREVDIFDLGLFKRAFIENSEALVGDEELVAYLKQWSEKSIDDFKAKDNESVLESADDLMLITDGDDMNYSFIYNGNEFRAEYTEDHWKIYDSYRVDSAKDMSYICEMLISEHPIHGKDMVSYRTADDMAYEWIQHNLVFALVNNVPEILERAKDVDFNPEDQGKSVLDYYLEYKKS